MDNTHLSNRELLERVIGRNGANRLYRGSLQPLFVPGHPANRHHERLAAARELVRRWLAEELRRLAVLSSPQQVRDYLRLTFGGAEEERFVVLFLDSQNRLIAAEEIFRGTLSPDERLSAGGREARTPLERRRDDLRP